MALRVSHAELMPLANDEEIRCCAMLKVWNLPQVIRIIAPRCSGVEITVIGLHARKTWRRAQHV